MLSSAISPPQRRLWQTAPMRFVTWNVNSVRLRMEALGRLTQEVRPDVVCLQEIKVDRERFPFEDIAALGYGHVEMEGYPGYHGVATLSRIPFERLDGPTWCGKQDGRHLGVRLEDGTEVHNFYVPAGGDEPDPEINNKFRHKLDFLAEMADWGQGMAAKGALLAGDLNVAPLPTDVWSHKQLLKVVSHTPIEVDALTAVQDAGGWTDLVRAVIDPETPLFSWWSYRARDWAKADRGRRLDHIWGVGPVVDRLSGATVLKEARGWEKPSDHAPVMADFRD